MSDPFLFSRIGYMYLPTADIDESFGWYTKHLGLKLKSKFQNRGAFVAVLDYPHSHAVSLLLTESADQHPIEIKRNGEAFPIAAFNCPDIEYTHRKLKENGVEVGDVKNHGSEEAKYFYFRDHEGNLLEAAWSIWDPHDDISEEFQK